MKPWILFFAVGFGTLAVIIGGGLGSKWLSDRQRRAARADSEDSLEHQISVKAAAQTFQIAILAIAGLGAIALFDGSPLTTGFAFAFLLIAIAAHWLIYARLRRRALSTDGTHEVP